MPNQPKTPTHPVRVDPELWDEFGRVCEEQETDRSAEIRAFMAWKCRRPGAKLPKRPQAGAQ